MKKILFLLFPLIGFGQVQIGDFINGETAWDYTGERAALSSDGTTVAVVSRYHDNYSGKIRIYENQMGNWIQKGQAISGTPGQFYGSGIAISANGNDIAIGISDNGGFNAGIIKVFTFGSGEWNLSGSIDGESPGDSAEIVSMSADGSIIAIGAPFNDGVQDAGHVRVYTKASGSWVQLGQDIDGQYSNDQFGSAISLSADGTTVAIGAKYHSQVFDSGGYAQVYKINGGQWQQVGQNIYGQMIYDLLGTSVSLSFDGTVLAVGAPYNNVNGVYSGRVRVFKNNNNLWEQLGQTIDGQAPNNFMGSCVSLSSDGTIIAVGLPQNSNNGFSSGCVKIFRYMGNTWNQFGNNINGIHFEDMLGSDLSLSGNGLTLTVGAPRNDVNGENSGQVSIFDLSLLLNSDTFVSDHFSIYPNPVSDRLNINLNVGLILEKVNVYSTSGQLVKTEKSNSFKVNDLSKGTYFLEIVTNKGKATKSIIIK